ncbi:UMP kinase [Coxiella endosymbiont of Amblyomma sculptum]|uniref:UMP kinase n=1 Tax=Coxiella endosymbiont of Amblyomma sculptum TaxID=2487929 RepID=UPI00132F1BD0|nr:UMP kinase [Coxiella endosymbiont of Amblyomma sculptum]QHG92683.1 UMP kinase [Coxiella endosymbiont of Amblyomma sculptum]
MEGEVRPLYWRILLKVSGAALIGQGACAIDPTVLDRMAKDIVQVYQLGIQIAVVIGGGNIFRGATLQKAGIGRITGDYMGMLATLMNALALRDAFERSDLPVCVLSAIPMIGIADAFHRRKAIYYLQQKRVVILAAGTGNPLVTTDSAASLRGIEIDADVVLKATNVDGVYSDDPEKNPKAKLYKHLTYQEVLKKELAVMDLAAFFQCRDHNMPIRIFNIKKSGTLLRVVMDIEEGTLVDRG